MRATQPVFKHPEWGGWQVFRYADVSRVLSEYATFSSDGRRMAQADGSQGEPDPIGSSILQMDPPRHRQLRNLVSQAFTPRMVAQLEPRITAITNELLDQVAGAGEMDVVRDLAYPLPAIVTAELMGLPTSDWKQLVAWSTDFAEALGNLRDAARQTDHDTRKDQQRDTVADAALRDLLAQPHDEHRSRGQGQNRAEPESPARRADAVHL